MWWQSLVTTFQWMNQVQVHTTAQQVPFYVHKVPEVVCDQDCEFNQKLYISNKLKISPSPYQQPFLFGMSSLMLLRALHGKLQSAAASQQLPAAGKHSSGKAWQKGVKDPAQVQFSSVQSLDPLGHQEDMRDDSAEILFQSFLQEALLSSSSMGKDARSLMLSIQHFLCQPRHRPPSKVPWRMVLCWRVTCPKHASFHLLTVSKVVFNKRGVVPVQGVIYTKNMTGIVERFLPPTSQIVNFNLNHNVRQNLWQSNTHTVHTEQKMFTLQHITIYLTLAPTVCTELVLQGGVNGQRPPRTCDAGDCSCLFIGSLCFNKSSIDLGTREKSVLIQAITRNTSNEKASTQSQTNHSLKQFNCQKQKKCPINAHSKQDIIGLKTWTLS